jgi:NAD(P)H dehydrogenase (quinone)
LLVSLGVPEGAAAVYADADRGAARCRLDAAGDDLEKPMGRPATPIADVVRAALA